MKKSMNFILADDHAIVRKGLKQILIDEFRDANVMEAADGHSVLKVLKNWSFDLMICDLTMPGMGGMELCKEVKVLRPALPILVLSMHAEAAYAIRALRLGASGYLTKESAPEEMIKAISQILNGGKYVSQNLAAMMAEYIGDSSNVNPHEQLSDRELEVLRQIVAGKSLSNIGSLFNLSPNTISTYRSRILQKMQMKNNAELVRYAIENNIN